MDRKEGIIHLGGSRSPLKKKDGSSSSKFYHSSFTSTVQENDQFQMTLPHGQNKPQQIVGIPQTVIFSQTFPRAFPPPPHSIQQKIVIQESRLSPITKRIIKKSPPRSVIIMERSPIKLQKIKDNVHGNHQQNQKNGCHDNSLIQRIVQISNEKNSQIISLKQLIATLRRTTHLQSSPRFTKITQSEPKQKNEIPHQNKHLSQQNNKLKYQLAQMKIIVGDITTALEQKVQKIISCYQEKIYNLTAQLDSNNKYIEFQNQLNNLKSSRISTKDQKLHSKNKQLSKKEESCQRTKRQHRKPQIQQPDRNPSSPHKPNVKFDPRLLQKQNTQLPKKQQKQNHSQCSKCKQLMKTIIKLNQKTFSKLS